MEPALTPTNPALRPRVRLIGQRSSDDPTIRETMPSTISPPARTTAASSSTASRPDYLIQMLAVMSSIAMILATRTILLLAVAGAFFLAHQAAGSGEVMGLWVSAAYGALVVCPLVWLYAARG